MTIFYLTKAKSPVLGFYMSALSHVPGLNAEQVTDQFLQAGCTRVPVKDIPVQLLLSDQNDQATFDRIHGILEELVQEHRG